MQITPLVVHNLYQQSNTEVILLYFLFYRSSIASDVTFAPEFFNTADTEQ